MVKNDTGCCAQVFSDIERDRLRAGAAQESVAILHQPSLAVDYLMCCRKERAGVPITEQRKDIVVPVPADIPLEPSRFAAPSYSL